MMNLPLTIELREENATGVTRGMIPENIPAELKKIGETVLNALFLGIGAGVIGYKLNEVKCERCGKTWHEPEFSFKTQFNLFIWKPKLTVYLKLYYHRDCGLWYVRDH